MKEPYIMNEGAIKPLKTKLDATKTPYNRASGYPEQRDFNRYTKSNVLSKNPSCKVPIRPLSNFEKVGAKWGAPSER